MLNPNFTLFVANLPVGSGMLWNHLHNACRLCAADSKACMIRCLYLPTNEVLGNPYLLRSAVMPIRFFCLPATSVSCVHCQQAYQSLLRLPWQHRENPSSGSKRLLSFYAYGGYAAKSFSLWGGSVHNCICPWSTCSCVLCHKSRR